MRFTSSLVLALTLLATTAAAQMPLMPKGGGTGIRNPTTVAALPTAAGLGRISLVTDGNGASCTSGGGSTLALCCEGAAAWTLCPASSSLDADLSAIAALSGTGLAARTNTDTWAQRSITNADAAITVTNGGGVAGNPTIGCANASTSAKGCASFTANDFTSNTGVISFGRAAAVGAGNTDLGASTCRFSSTGIVCEGSISDDLETFLEFSNPSSSDRVIQFPSTPGTVVLDNDTTITDLQGTGLTVTGGQLNCSDATTSAKGCASFNSSYFTATSGAVTIAPSSLVSSLIADGNIAYNDMNTTANLLPSQNPGLAAHQCFFTSTAEATPGGIVCEGASNNLYEGVLSFPDPMTDITWSMPNYGGNVAIDATPFNVRVYGATGDGSTNDTTAITNAINAQQAAGGTKPVYFPCGVYSIDGVDPETGISDKVISSALALIGESRDCVTINGGVASPLFTDTVFDIRASLTVRGITFTNLPTLALYNNTTGNVPRIEIEDSRFTNVGSPVYWNNPSATSSVDAIRIRGNLLNGADRGFHLAADDIDSATITENVILNTKKVAIQVGYDLDTSQDTETRYVITNNVVDGVVGAGGAQESANGILVQGRECIVQGNTIRNLATTTNDNAEGIYTKCRYGSIVGNTLVDAGEQEGFINVKGNSKIGQPGATSPRGYGVVVANNTLRCENNNPCRGINIGTDDVRVTGNYLEKFKGRVIGNQLDAQIDNVVVEDNTIYDSSGTTVIGFEHYGNGLVIRNNIVDTYTNASSHHAINITTGASHSLDNVVVDGNQIRNGTGTDARCIRIDNAATMSILDVRVTGNICDTANYGVAISGAVALASLVVDNNAFFGITQSQTVALVSSAPAPTVFTIGENYGYGPNDMHTGYTVANITNRRAWPNITTGRTAPTLSLSSLGLGAGEVGLYLRQDAPPTGQTPSEVLYVTVNGGTDWTAVGAFGAAIDSSEITDGAITSSDISGTAGITAAQIADGTLTTSDLSASAGITNAQHANMAANTIKGNNTGGNAAPSDLSAVNVTAMLSAVVGDSGSGGTKGLVPAPGSGDTAAGKYLKADGTWTVPPTGTPTFAQPSVAVGLSVQNGSGTNAAYANAAPALSQAIAPTWTDLHKFYPGNSATPANAILIDMPVPGIAGTRDSHWLQTRGTSFDASAHNADWREFVDVTSNAGASTWTIQSRIDAASFANRLTLTDGGALTVPGAISASNFSGSSSGTNSGDQTITLGTDLSGSCNQTACTLNATIATGAVTSGKIFDGTITTSDISNTAGITAAQIADGTLTTSDLSASAGITSAQIADGTITTSDISGTAGITSGQIADGTLMNGDINASAGIAVSKLAPLSAGQILISNATPTAQWQTPAGDLAMNTSASFSIQPGRITEAMMATADFGSFSCNVAGTDCLLDATSDGAGVAVTSGGIATASNEQLFLTDVADGSFTCAANRKGAAAIVDAGGTIMFCDDAGTPTKKYVALTTSSTGALPTHAHAGSDITSSVVGTTYGGTGQNWSASSGIPLLTTGTASLLSSTGTGNVVRAQSPQFNPASASTAPFTIGTNATNVAVSGLNADQVDGFEAASLLQLANTQTVTGAKTFQSTITSDVGDAVTGFTMTNDATETLSLVNATSAPKILFNTTAANDVILETRLSAATQFAARTDGMLLWYNAAGTAITSSVADVSDLGIAVRQLSANTNTPNRLLQLDAETSGTPTAGFGADIEVVAEDSLANDGNQLVGRVRTQWVDVSNASRDSKMVFTIVSSSVVANTNTDALSITGDDNGKARIASLVPGVALSASGWITNSTLTPTLTPSPVGPYIVTAVNMNTTVLWANGGSCTPLFSVGTSVTPTLFVSSAAGLGSATTQGRYQRSGTSAFLGTETQAAVGRYQSAAATLQATLTSGCTTPTGGRTLVTVEYQLVDTQP